MKVHPTGVLSKEQKMQTYICAKNVIHTVHNFGTIVNNRGKKQVKTKQNY